MDSIGGKRQGSWRSRSAGDQHDMCYSPTEYGVAWCGTACKMQIAACRRMTYYSNYRKHIFVPARYYARVLFVDLPAAAGAAAPLPSFNPISAIIPAESRQSRATVPTTPEGPVFEQARAQG